eukprot:SM000032S12151  [mRNA]  locus=s32:938599:942338:+ [translate_table: standard]
MRPAVSSSLCSAVKWDPRYSPAPSVKNYRRGERPRLPEGDDGVGIGSGGPSPGLSSEAGLPGGEDAGADVPTTSRKGAVNGSGSGRQLLAPHNTGASGHDHAEGKWELSKLVDLEEVRSKLSRVRVLRRLFDSRQAFPDKRRLSSVQDFFQYTEEEGRRLFRELDRDADGQVTLADLEELMRRRKLPPRYARSFLRRARRSWLAKSFGWDEFLLLMEQKEPTMLRAFNSLSLSESGTLQKSQVLDSLRRAGLPATEENAKAMMRCLDADNDEGQVAYGQFRNFMLLLPPERLGGDASMVWFEAATVVPMSPPIMIPAGSVLKSALAGGLACGLSTCVMHPLDTLKTRVQASTLSFSDVIGTIPQLGLTGLYRGCIPAIIGQFTSHGLRTGVFEVGKVLLKHVAPKLPDIQVQSTSSFCSAVLGTAWRIPGEVLKQRLQAGLYPNVWEAFVGTIRQDGVPGLFRGTSATLCREVPFYVAGMVIYEEAKKIVRRLLDRELAPWETIVVGGASGGAAAVCTTPFDVIKTRMMTAAPGMAKGLLATGRAIATNEGIPALFKGALPRFFWIAPLGAMNFAGYELAKRALENQELEAKRLAEGGAEAGSAVRLEQHAL